MSLFKNTSGQKVRVFAFDATTGLPKVSDSANITASVSKDFGAFADLTDTSASEEDSTKAKGYYLFDISQTETNADDIAITGRSSTSNIVVVGAPARMATRPPNAGALSIDSSGRVDVIKVNGTSQTARDLGASVLLSSGTGTGQLSLSSGLVTLAAVTHTGAVIPTVTTLTNLPAITTDWLTGTGVAASAVTKIQAGLATPTNITAGTITTVTTLTNLPAAPTDWLTAAAVAAAAVTKIQAGLSTYAGGDTSGTTTLLARLTSTRSGYLDNLSAGAVALASGVTVITNNDKTGYTLTVTPPTAAAIATAVLTSLCTEPTAVVGASPTVIAALSWLLTLSRNKITQTSTNQVLKADNGSTTIATSPVSDDGTTFTRGEFA